MVGKHLLKKRNYYNFLNIYRTNSTNLVQKQNLKFNYLALQLANFFYFYLRNNNFGNSKPRYIGLIRRVIELFYQSESLTTIFLR